jgi:uncharacterized membrane-anchored protein
MMWTRLLIAAGAVLVLGAVNVSIAGKEGIKRDGEVVFLELAPVDPRSLMQGDYMALRFALARQIEPADMREGEVRHVNVTLDARRVAQLSAGTESAAIKLRYRLRNNQIWLGTNAFFFEEGSAARFEPARFGEFRVDRASGEAVLVGLRGADLKEP